MQSERSNQHYITNTTKQIYFKWVNTLNSFYLPIDAEWSLVDLIQYVKIVVQNKHIELVQGGQGTDLLRAEDADAVEPLPDVKVFDKFTFDWCNNDLVFYIRKIPEVEVEVEVRDEIELEEIRIGAIMNRFKRERARRELRVRRDREIRSVIQCSGGGGGLALAEVVAVDRDCVICMESFPITDWTPYGCQHFAYTTCVKSCIQTNNNRCSICRIE
jgi:hypothetical protein